MLTLRSRSGASSGLAQPKTQSRGQRILQVLQEVQPQQTLEIAVEPDVSLPYAILRDPSASPALRHWVHAGVHPAAVAYAASALHNATLLSRADLRTGLAAMELGPVAVPYSILWPRLNPQLALEVPAPPYPQPFPLLFEPSL